MTTVARTARAPRPPAVRITIGLLAVLGISGVFGGLELTMGFAKGSALPEEWLADIPLIDSWFVPGLVLGIGFGLGSLVAAYGLLARPRWGWLGWVVRATGHHWSWLATIALGVGQAVWILLELIYLPEASWFQAVYGPIGVALALLPLRASVSRYARTGA